VKPGRETGRERKTNRYPRGENAGSWPVSSTALEIELTKIPTNLVRKGSRRKNRATTGVN